MIQKFYHGGHLGDCIYSLYAIKQMGGGELYIGPHNHGNWGPEQWQAILPLLKYQNYISHADIVLEKPDDLTYDFTKTWGDTDYSDHFEWNWERKPGNISLKKRDFLNASRGRISLSEALHILSVSPGPWIGAPKRSSDVDIIIHAPIHKMTRSKDDYEQIISDLESFGAKVGFIGDDQVYEWVSEKRNIIRTTDLLQAAMMIASAKVFMGTASCCYVIAEALHKLRFVDVFQPAEGAIPRDESGWDTASWPVERVVASVKRALDL